MWRLLGCENINELVPLQSIKNFLTIMMNYDQKFIYFPEMDTIESKQFDDSIVGIISKDGIFYIKNKMEIERIHKSFYILWLNRFNNFSNKKTRCNSQPNQSISERNKFVPIICDKSKVIDRKRNANSQIARYDLLIKIGEQYK